MRYHPLVIKWCCSLASKCKEKGYESIRNMLPLPHQESMEKENCLRPKQRKKKSGEPKRLNQPYERNSTELKRRQMKERKKRRSYLNNI